MDLPHAVAWVGTPEQFQQLVDDVKRQTAVRREQNTAVTFELKGVTGSVSLAIVFPKSVAAKRKRTSVESGELRPDGKPHLLFANRLGGVPEAIQAGLEHEGARQRASNMHFQSKVFTDDGKLVEALVGKAWSVALKDATARQPWKDEAVRCNHSRLNAHWDGLKTAAAASQELKAFIDGFAADEGGGPSESAKGSESSGGGESGPGSE
jgi:hypothetical protein